MKKTFDQYFLDVSGRSPSTSGYSTETLEMLRRYYDLGAGLEAIIGPRPSYTTSQAAAALNTQLRKSYKIQLHGIGKDPYRKFYNHVDHFSWLKVEHFLIVHMYAIDKDQSFVANKTIAVKIGWINQGETDPDVIQRAERKVADALQIIKNDRKTFTVEQRHTLGKSGSYHVIRANWLTIIPLYSLFDPELALTIRMRKGVRYRILSLIRAAVMSFCDGLKQLMKLQRKKYLPDLVTMDEVDYQSAKEIWHGIVDRHGLGSRMTDPDRIVPAYEYPNLILTVKDAFIENLIKHLDVSKLVETDINRRLVIVRAY